jgi:hypothetical protein
VRPRRPAGASARPLNFTVMRLSVLALISLVCASASRAGIPSDAAWCSQGLPSGWTRLNSAPPQAPQFRHVMDAKYGPRKRTREYWFSGPDGQFVLCVRLRDVPEWFAFRPAGDTYSVSEQTITNY